MTLDIDASRELISDREEAEVVEDRVEGGSDYWSHTKQQVWPSIWNSIALFLKCQPMKLKIISNRGLAR